MNRYPAIALIEFSSVAVGIKAGDAMVKRAPITVLKSGTVHNGKYLVFVGGSVASVSESYDAGLSVGGDLVIDRVLLADVHPQVHDAVLGARQTCSSDALGIIETSTVAAMVRATDAGVKGADVQIVEIRLADDLGGKALSIFAGRVEDVEAAVEIAKGVVTPADFWLQATLIPRLHAQMAKQIDKSTYFARAAVQKLEDGEA